MLEIAGWIFVDVVLRMLMQLIPANAITLRAGVERSKENEQ